MSVQFNQTALWQNLRVVNQLQKEEIEILEKLIEVLPSSEDEVIDEWLDRLERHTKHRFTDEEARMIRSGYPFLSEHRREHTLAMDRIRKARTDWEEIGRAHVELQSHSDLVCRLLLEKKKKNKYTAKQKKKKQK